MISTSLFLILAQGRIKIRIIEGAKNQKFKINISQKRSKISIFRFRERWFFNFIGQAAFMPATVLPKPSTPFQNINSPITFNVIFEGVTEDEEEEERPLNLSIKNRKTAEIWNPITSCELEEKTSPQLPNTDSAQSKKKYQVCFLKTQLRAFLLILRDDKSEQFNHCYIASLLFISVYTVWENIQTFLDLIHTSLNSFRRTSLSVRILRKEISSEIRHEKTYVHSHR